MVPTAGQTSAAPFVQQSTAPSWNGLHGLPVRGLKPMGVSEHALPTVTTQSLHTVTG